MSIRALAPASSANLGPAFDCAAAALDLWNELVVEEAPGAFGVEIEGEGAADLPRDATHLALRAFARFAPVEGHTFRFVNRIPLERGLGSSAAAIALGLVAGCAAAGRAVDPAELLVHGLAFESHSDNLAAALHGGVCVAWRNGDIHAARIATELPLALVVAVPAAQTNTAASRSVLPETVSHEDAARNAGFAALLGAAIASGDARLLQSALHDQLHERYRAGGSPLLRQLGEHAPDGAVGLTLSGSGPSVVVWAPHDRAGEVADELTRTIPDDAQVLHLRVATEGAHLT